MASKKQLIGKRPRRLGISGVVLGGLALLACELPLILAFIGVSGLGVFATSMVTSPLLAFVGISLLIAGILVWISPSLIRIMSKS